MYLLFIITKFAYTMAIEQVCAVPENSLNVTEIEGRCFLACVSKKFPDKVGMWNYSLSNYWPFVSRTNCSTSNELYQCTVGCVRSQLIMENEVICKMNCFFHCKQLKDSLRCDGLTPLCHPWIREDCNITCDGFIRNNANPCYKGCELKDVLPVSENQNQLQIPHAPIDPPRLIPVQDSQKAGQFIVDLSGSVPQLQSCESANENDNVVSPVAFLFKFEDMNSHNASFNWTESPFVTLNLSGYACHQLLVSFAVGGVAGLSKFSPKASIKLSRNESMISVANPPVYLEVTDMIDTRIGFFGHVILCVSWNGSLDQDDGNLSHFIVTATPDHMANVTNSMCGCKPWSQIVSHDQNSVYIRANSSEALPMMSCQYSIQVHAVGPYGTSNPLKGIHDVQTTFDPKGIQFECQRLWQIRGFSFNLTWILPDYVWLGNAIHQFVVILKLTGGTETSSVPIESSTISFQDLRANPIKFSVNQIFNFTNHSIHAPIHLFETYVNWNSSISYTPPRYGYNCTVSTVSPRPYPVENFMVTSCSVNDSTINLFLMWSPPSVINGALDSYDVCVGNEPLEPNEEIFNTSHDCLLKQVTNDVIIVLGQTKYPICIQIRAHNLYAPGNWSEPSVIDSAAIDKCYSSASSTNNIGFIAGSLGGFMLLVLLVSCIIAPLAFRYMRMRKLVTAAQEPYEPMFSGRSNTLLLERRSTTLHASPRPDNWEIPATEIIMEDPLGEGAHGEVYKGVIKCPIVNPKVPSSVKNSICTPVAIKLLKLSAQGNEKKDFLSEIEMMKKVAEGQNPHVVGLLGCVTIQEPLCLITEFVKFGDLLSYLRTNMRKFTGKSTNEEENAYTELGNVSPIDLISFAYQIASGMEYLSSLGIIHRDLACRNILVDEGKVLKITDFGMSRETDEIYVQKRTGRVPLKWMAIESIIAREFTSASDVWSFGITLWEIGTLGGCPYPSIQNEDLLSHLRRGYRMEKPDNCSPEVYEIMLLCWNEQSQKRPPFTELRLKFDAMLLADKKNDYIDLRVDQSKLYYQQLSPDHKNTDKMKSASNLDHPQLFFSSDTIGACGDVEKGQMDHAHNIKIRPVSMNLSYDQGNPYVDLPSRTAATSLTLISDLREMSGPVEAQDPPSI